MEEEIVPIRASIIVYMEDTIENIQNTIDELTTTINSNN